MSQAGSLLVKGKVRVHTKKSQKGEWKQAVVYIKADYREMIEEFDNKEVEILINPQSTVEQTNSTVDRQLLECLVSLFIKAFQNEKIASELLKYEETDRILKMLEGE